ncbi:MAG: acyl-CoA carboxylase subunit beta [Chloroflexi bacterium]|nr:acyl-CoA carboxylase subunit beta [Chloroflexota bacterium]
MSMQEKLNEILAEKEKLSRGGGSEAVEQQHKLGKLTVRERIEKLVDAGSFRERGLWDRPSVTGFPIDGEELPGDGVVTGSGKIAGRDVQIYAQDYTVARGTVGNIHARRILTTIEAALTARRPCIGLLDSAGTRLEDSLASPKFTSLASIMAAQSRASGVVPQIRVVMGPCVGEAAISAGLADFVIMVKKTAELHVAALDSGAEELGQAKMHASVSGCCDLLAENDLDALEQCRHLLGFLPSNNTEKAGRIENGDRPDRATPEIFDLVPTDPSKSYDMRKLIRPIVDNGDYLEIRPQFARNMLVGFARLGGRTAGIIANNPMFLGGAIDINAADKEARFVRFCDAFNIPLIWMADTPAFLPGTDQEHRGIIRHGAHVIHAIAEATVPKISLTVRKRYGGGSLAMSCQELRNDVTIAWPTAEFGMLGPDELVAILYRKELQSAPNPEEVRRRRVEEIKAKLVAVGRSINEEYINPADTRARLIEILDLLSSKADERPAKKHENIPL